MTLNTDFLDQLEYDLKEKRDEGFAQMWEAKGAINLLRHLRKIAGPKPGVMRADAQTDAPPVE